ncbi:MAG: glutaredoxin family protein [Endozoicomonadaceae bacterium]|nr:glutaredoxin family protein [Endozoicomonadaceae bacterium]
MILFLYTTECCALCEQALDILLNLKLAEPFSLELVDIAESDALTKRYGERIPMIQMAPNGRVLDWPFDAMQVRSLLESATIPVDDV